MHFCCPQEVSRTPPVLHNMAPNVLKLQHLVAQQ